MDRPQRRFHAQQDNEPLDLAPAAVMQMVTDVAAGLRPLRRFEASGFTEPVNERLGFDNIAWFDIERQIHMSDSFPDFRAATR